MRLVRRVYGTEFDKWLMTLARDYTPPDDAGPISTMRHAPDDGVTLRID